MINLPTSLTLLRVVLIPLLVVVFYLPWSWNYLAAAGIFAFAGFTDWADGYLARRLGQETRFGAFLDPVADKLIVVVALVVLLQRQATLAFALPTMIIIGRELLISALREWMAELGQRASVAVSGIGKVKTTLQMVAITALLVFDRDGSFPALNLVALGLLYSAALLTLWSMAIYLRAAWPEMLRAQPVSQAENQQDIRR
ncbi:MAG: CDP-diacylglycerol--glycerol-3-phosphate 3-phosphatidyltransferase [Gammaproteobacteria bacterium]|nr:CDP-diacylglycerol--glycerol-3-phosphate 3-phosphatidyltransferase [Gammaproteobacteria bacterium]MBK9427763.1 CDP-diacylglycerol--glycerol-3-phosphate 3-phosphatidyltransferase [Gammaproteobacteria bacterium]